MPLKTWNFLRFVGCGTMFTGRRHTVLTTCLPKQRAISLCYVVKGTFWDRAVRACHSLRAEAICGLAQLCECLCRNTVCAVYVGSETHPVCDVRRQYLCRVIWSSKTTKCVWTDDVRHSRAFRLTAALLCTRTFSRALYACQNIISRFISLQSYFICLHRKKKTDSGPLS